MAHTMPPAQSSDTQRLISAGVAASDRQGAPVVDTVFSFEAPVDTLPLRREVPAERGTQDQPGPPVVPPLSAHQMLAAKREQQRSMIAYSMQVAVYAASCACSGPWCSLHACQTEVRQRHT